MPEIAARYAVPEAYVERVLEDAATAHPRKNGRGIERLAIGLLLSMLVAGLLWTVTGEPAAGILGGIGTYVVASMLVGRR